MGRHGRQAGLRGLAEVRPRRWDRLYLGAGIGNQIHRVTGTALLPAGIREWTLVVKTFVLDPDTVDPERTRPAGREYWKREWHVYRSEWQQTLDGPFRAARCLGSGEFNDTAAQVALDRAGRLERVRPAAVANAAVR